MRRRTILAGLTGLTAGLALPGIARAEPQSRPNGPWIQPEQVVQKAALTANEDLGPKLASIAARSGGRMSVEIAGRSAQGRPIHLARFGEPGPGRTPVLIQTQIHGGEPLGTEVALQLMQTLAGSSHPTVLSILDKLAIWFIPRLNMDGADFRDADGHLVQRRVNSQAWNPGEWGLAADTPAPWYQFEQGAAPGFDLNRDFNPDLRRRLGPGDEALLPGEWGVAPGYFVTPEARTSAAVFQRMRPKVFIDHHHRFTNVQSETDNQLTTLMLSGLVTNGTPDHPLDPAVRDLSLRVNVHVWDRLSALGESPYGGITRYWDVDVPTTALGAYALNGAAIMLYETRGAAQKSMGMLTRQSLAGMAATLEGLTDGSVAAADPARYHDIPPAGPDISNPRTDV